MIGFFRFVLVVMLLVIVGMTSAVLTMHFAIHGSEVSIPDFHGMTVADAGQRAAAAGLTLHVENKLYSADVPAGRVANQSPAAGAIVRRGWRVWLTESLGPQKLAIPNVLGQDQRIASIDIRRAGLQTGTVAVLAHPGAQAGAVIAQSPAPDASGVSSPVVNLLVAAEAASPSPLSHSLCPISRGSSSPPPLSPWRTPDCKWLLSKLRTPTFPQPQLRARRPRRRLPLPEPSSRRIRRPVPASMPPRRFN